MPTLVTKYAPPPAGLASEQAEPRGWAAVAQAALRPHHVTRVDDTHVIVLVPPQPDYDIAAPETLRSSPPEAVRSHRAVEIATALLVPLTPGKAEIGGGSIYAQPLESVVQSHHDHTLVLELANETWRDDVMAFDEGDGVSSQLLAGLRATAGGDSPWDATVQPALRYGDVTLSNVSASTLTLTVPQRGVRPRGARVPLALRPARRRRLAPARAPPPPSASTPCRGSPSSSAR